MDVLGASGERGIALRGRVGFRKYGADGRAAADPGSRVRHIADIRVVKPLIRITDCHRPTREHERLADGAAAVHRNRQLGETIGAACDVRGEHRHAIASLDQLHGRRISRIHLERYGAASPDDEVHTADTDQSERASRRSGQLAGGAPQGRVKPPRRIIVWREDIAAVAKGPGAETAFADELLRESEGHAVAAVGDERGSNPVIPVCVPARRARRDTR